ncbi:MAG: SDR family NAD(P)-dependent oxidoreductase [Betaproteobacteria bacterium]
MSGAAADFLRLGGRVAIVTGGGRNIGRACALRLAQAGAKVVVADYIEANAQDVAAEIEALGGQALALPLDIANLASVQAMVAAVSQHFGTVHILVNNAAKFSSLTYKPMDEIPLQEWDEVIHTNITGSFYCAREVLPHMKREGWGRIINVSSGTYRMGRPLFLHYVSTKAAMMGMSRSMARELGPHGITVNTVLPGVVLHGLQSSRLPEDYKAMIQGMQCVPKPLDCDALADAVAFLGSDAARFITGQELAVDGGLTHGG